MASATDIRPVLLDFPNPRLFYLYLSETYLMQIGKLARQVEKASEIFKRLGGMVEQAQYLRRLALPLHSNKQLVGRRSMSIRRRRVTRSTAAAAVRFSHPSQSLYRISPSSTYAGSSTLSAHQLTTVCGLSHPFPGLITHER